MKSEAEQVPTKSLPSTLVWEAGSTHFAVRSRTALLKQRWNNRHSYIFLKYTSIWLTRRLNVTLWVSSLFWKTVGSFSLMLTSLTLIKTERSSPGGYSLPGNSSMCRHPPVCTVKHCCGFQSILQGLPWNHSCWDHWGTGGCLPGLLKDSQPIKCSPDPKPGSLALDRGCPLNHFSSQLSSHSAEKGSFDLVGCTDKIKFTKWTKSISRRSGIRPWNVREGWEEGSGEKEVPPSNKKFKRENKSINEKVEILLQIYKHLAFTRCLGWVESSGESIQKFLEFFVFILINRFGVRYWVDLSHDLKGQTLITCFVVFTTFIKSKLLSNFQVSLSENIKWKITAFSKKKMGKVLYIRTDNVN